MFRLARSWHDPNRTLHSFATTMLIHFRVRRVLDVGYVELGLVAVA
jgi:hypothetical protein